MKTSPEKKKEAAEALAGCLQACGVEIGAEPLWVLLATAHPFADSMQQFLLGRAFPSLDWAVAQMEFRRPAELVMLVENLRSEGAEQIELIFDQDEGGEA